MVARVTLDWLKVSAGNVSVISSITNMDATSGINIGPVPTVSDGSQVIARATAVDVDLWLSWGLSPSQSVNIGTSQILAGTTVLLVPPLTAGQSYFFIPKSSVGAGGATGVASVADAALATLLAGTIVVGGISRRPIATIVRPGDTNAYASGDLIANSVTAGSVTPISFTAGVNSKGGMVRRALLRKSSNVLTNASFRLHLYAAAPTVTNGDNGAWLSNQSIGYLGAIDITVDKAFSDGAVGTGVPLVGSEINFTADTVYGLLEARGAYVPISVEVFNIYLEVLANA